MLRRSIRRSLGRPVRSDQRRRELEPPSSDMQPPPLGAHCYRGGSGGRRLFSIGLLGPRTDTPLLGPLAYARCPETLVGSISERLAAGTGPRSLRGTKA